MRSLCVFCGSSQGSRPAYTASAQAVGALIALRNWTLVYGGGRVGLMGAVADAALAAGGRVIGVLPRGLAGRERLHHGLTELHLVDSMHERKALMARLSDGFLALPGGMGTLEELCEILTWAQLGIHFKPVALLNVEGYFDSLLGFFDHATAEGMLKPAHRRLLLTGDDPVQLLDAAAAYPRPPIKPWFDQTAT